MEIKEKRKINCVFDGSCLPKNPGGKMGIGAAIFEGFGNNKKLLKKFSKEESANPNNTNNVAEYKAIIWIMQELIKLKLEKEQIRIYGDSDLVISQMNKDFKIKRGNYVEYAKEALELTSKFIDIDFIWIPRTRNSYADNLSRTKSVN